MFCAYKGPFGVPAGINTYQSNSDYNSIPRIRGFADSRTRSEPNFGKRGSDTRVRVHLKRMRTSVPIRLTTPRIRESANPLIRESANPRIRGSADPRIRGSADSRIRGFANQRIRGFADPRSRETDWHRSSHSFQMNANTCIGPAFSEIRF